MNFRSNKLDGHYSGASSEPGGPSLASLMLFSLHQRLALPSLPLAVVWVQRRDRLFWRQVVSQLDVHRQRPRLNLRIDVEIDAATDRSGKRRPHDHHTVAAHENRRPPAQFLHQSLPKLGPADSGAVFSILENRYPLAEEIGGNDDRPQRDI